MKIVTEGTVQTLVEQKVPLEVAQSGMDSVAEALTSETLEPVFTVFKLASIAGCVEKAAYTMLSIIFETLRENNVVISLDPRTEEWWQLLTSAFDARLTQTSFMLITLAPKETMKVIKAFRELLGHDNALSGSNFERN